MKLEKLIFYALIFLLFFQGRIIWHSFGPQFNEWASFYLYATDILIMAVIFLWLMRERRNLNFKNIVQNLKQPVLLALGIFLLVDFLSVWVADNFWLSFYGFIKVAEFAVLFLYVRYNFIQHYNLVSFWRIFIASASLQSAVALLQFFGQKSLGFKLLFESVLGADIAGVAKIDIGTQKIIRAYGLVPHPNILAAILILAIFGLAYLFINNYEKYCHPELDLGSRFRSKKNIARSILYILIFIILASALFFTFSRSVIVIGFGFLFLWLLFAFWRQKEYRRPIIIFFILLLIVCGSLFAVYHQYVLARYDVVAATQSQAFDLRAFYNKMAIDFIKISPVWGVGQGNFVWDFSRPGYFQNWMYQPVHNIYLLITSETGIAGLLAFLAFLVFIIKNFYEVKVQGKAGVYSLLFIVYSLLIIGFFDHFLWDLQQGQLIFWLFLGILAGWSLKNTAHSGVSRKIPS